MAIQVQTIGTTDLRLAADIIKTNYAAGRSIGGQAGRVMGHTRAMMVRLPAGGFSITGSYVMLGRDGGGNGNFNGSNDTALRIGGDSAGTLARRPTARYRSAGVEAYAGTAGAEGQFASLPAMGAAPTSWLLIEGVRNIGNDANPVWKGWSAICPIGSGSPSSAVAPTNISAAWISGTTGALLRQIFSIFGTTRSPVGLAIEQVAVMAGDFPWDTANNRPHHDAIAALAGVGGHPFLTYQSLVAAQNAGTLPYADCDQGLANLDHWWTLRTLAEGLANSGTAGMATLAQNPAPGGLADVGDIAPAHWYGGAPTVFEPVVKFTGGRGARPTVALGSYEAGTTAMQRRWIDMTSSTVVRDWASVTSFGSGAWMVSDLLPSGRYRLEVRDSNDPAKAGSSDDWLVGAKAAFISQSGIQRSFQEGGTPPGSNILGVAVASGAQGLLVALDNANAGGSAGYARPQLVTVRLRPGETPVMGQGGVLLLNDWNRHNPGEPLLMANMAMNGTAMLHWANDDAAYLNSVGNSQASFRFMGTVGMQPDAASGNNSGVVEMFAAALGREIDRWVVMWTPGMSGDSAVRTTFMAGLDARFSNAAGAPVIVLPPWRGHRNASSDAATVLKRQEHLDFVAQLGPRGLLGPYWADIVNDGDDASGGVGSLHPAFCSSFGVPNASLPVSDGNQVGQGRVGRGFGTVVAWSFDPTIKAHGPRVIAAWYRDAGRLVIEVELGRRVRTLNGAAISNQFWISTDNGATFGQGGFTVALSPDGTRAVLTSSGAAFPASGVRVDYARLWPFPPATDPFESQTERKLDGLIYDDQAHRGGTNFAAGQRAGNPCQGSNRVGVGQAGVAVTARGPARLVTTERFAGSRSVTVRMLAADGVTVLREATLPIMAS